MSPDPRQECRCGYVRGSHQPVCQTCGCRGFLHAFLVFDVELPAGVTEERVYGGQSLAGQSLLACSHDPEHRRGDFCAFCKAEARFTEGLSLPVRMLGYAPLELALFQ